MYTRRKFLISSASWLGGLAIRPLKGLDPVVDEGKIGRVTTKSISVYNRPSDTSQILYQRFRDDLVNIYDEIISEEGPEYDPRWYRVWRGYVHSAYPQQVKFRYNPVITDIPKKSGQLAEGTIPMTQSMRYLGFSKRW